MSRSQRQQGTGCRGAWYRSSQISIPRCVACVGAVSPVAKAVEYEEDPFFFAELYAALYVAQTKFHTGLVQLVESEMS